MEKEAGQQEHKVPRISFEDIDGIVQSATFWRPHIQKIAEQFKLCEGNQPVQFTVPTYPGDNAVFIVEGRWIVKFFSDSQFTKGESFRVEMYLYSRVFPQQHQQHLSYVPQFIGKGSLSELYGETDPSIWSWPFLIISVMHGKPVKLLKDELTQEMKIEFAKDLGYIFKALHATKLPPSDTTDNHHNNTTLQAFKEGYFEEFLNKRLQIAIEKHNKWKHLSPRLLEQLPSYLPTTAAELIQEPLALLHGDLHHEHAFVSLKEKEDGRQHIHVDGMIDFGDSCLGSPLYDFVFLYLSTFRSNKKQLKAFLETYYPEGYDNQSFVRRCFIFTLLHEFNALNMREEGYMLDASAVQSLEEYATLLWDVTCPQELPQLVITPWQQ